MSKKTLIATIVSLLALSSSGCSSEPGGILSYFQVIPFVLMLLSIAVLPLIKSTEHWWHQNSSKLKVSLVLGGLVAAIYALKGSHGFHALMHTTEEYVSFIMYVATFAVVTGGLKIDGDIKASPGVNTLIIGIGAILSSVVSTAGAALIITPLLLSNNKERKKTSHTFVFVIFIVANCAGLMLPPGDPPLFLGFLQGVPALWMLQNLSLQWLFVNGSLLGIYFFVDLYFYNQETKEDIYFDNTNITPLSLRGSVNIYILLGVLASVLLLRHDFFAFDREFALLLLSITSLAVTKSETRKSAGFSWDPIKEVAWLFIGIFLTMIPALDLLRHVAPSMGIDSAGSFYWLTGVLSGFLDNAPTYLTFLEIAKAGSSSTDLALTAGYVNEVYLAAISVAAVFFGAMTYIGNAPNFMVKAIAEKWGISMPSFFGYMIWSVTVLLPILVANYFLFY